jgi:hypothetical protein
MRTPRAWFRPSPHALALLGLVMLSARASAADLPPAEERPSSVTAAIREPEPAPFAPRGTAGGGPSPKRELPDYDGRGPRSSTVGEDLLWVPRVLLSPVYLTTEYVIRRPLGAAISAAERANVPEVLYNFFFFGPDHKAGVVPIAFAEFGFLPSVGVYAFWDNAGARGNDLSARFSVWTSDWIAGSIGDRVRFRGNDSFSIKLTAVRRPDRTFFGLGPNSLQGDISRYGEDWLEASGTLDVPLWRSSHFKVGAGARYVNLYHGDFGGDPSVETQAAHGVFPLPYGFGQGHSIPFNHALLALDSRAPAGGWGARLEAQAEQGADVDQSPASAWLRYEGTAGVFYDVRGRVVSLSASALFADPLERGGQIPFTELISLGGNIPMLSSLATGTGLMPGFYPGRLVDRSAAVATLHYRWPIWAWLDGSLQGAVGNVFGEHLEEFKPRLLRFSAALGIESTGPSESRFQVLVGIGSETFDHGGQIDSVRLAIGTNRF